MPEAVARAAATGTPGARGGRLSAGGGAAAGHRQAAVGCARRARHAANLAQARELASARCRTTAQCACASWWRPWPHRQRTRPSRRRANGRRQARMRLGQAKKLFIGQGRCAGRARAPHRWASSVAYARRARRSARRTPSRATRRSTPGARRCKLHWRQHCCSRGDGPRHSRRAPAKPRSCRACSARTTTIPILLAFARAHRRPASRPRPFHHSARCAGHASPSSGRKPGCGARGCLPNPPTNLQERMTLYWSSARRLAALPAAKEAEKGATPSRQR